MHKKINLYPYNIIMSQMKPNSLSTRLIGVALFFSTLLAGCGNNSSKKNTDSAHLQFTLGVMASVDYLPFAVALDKGIYDSLGLDLRIEPFFSPVERDAALQGGTLDGTVTDYTSAALLSASGFPLLVDMKCDGAFRLIVGRDKPITAIQDLKGKKLALSSNTVIEYTTDKLLVQAGIDPADVEKVEIAKIPLRMEMLQSGEVDAAVLPEPFASMAIERGLVALISTKDLDIELTGIAMTREVAQKSAVMDLLHQGYNLGVEYMKQHPRTEWVKVLVETLGVSEEVALSMVIPDFTQVASPRSQDLADMNAWLKAKKLVEESYSESQLLR